VNLDDAPFTIVGVVSDSLQPPPANPRADLWVALTHDPVFGDLEKRRGGHYLRIIGRLRKGIAPSAAQAELSAIGSVLARDYPKDNAGWEVRVVPLADTVVRGVRTALLVLLGAVGLVFLIACANVANLLLVRAGARSREVAIRTALGAGRARLLRQFLTESLVLALAGGVLGVALAFAGVRGLRAWVPADLPRLNEIALDSRVLLFSLAASFAAAFLFGLAPAMDASRVELSEALKEGSMGAGESGSRRRIRNLLVIGETAFSFILLIGAALLGRSFERLQHVDLGIRPAQVLSSGMSLPRTKYSKPEQWLGFYGQLVERLKTQPGVESVTAALPLPLSGGGLNFSFQVEGRASTTPSAEQDANYTSVLGDYFRVLGVRLVSGRLFDARDAGGTPNVCLISSAFARQHFPGENPLGKRLLFGFVATKAREIVGIVSDVHRDGPAVPSRPEMYVPFAQDPCWAAYVAIRVPEGRDPLLLASALREQVRALDPEMPVSDIQPFTQTVSDAVAQPRFRTTLLALFGATALLLAVIGIYGVISYTVGRRTREVGIRMTLGASAGDVLRLVLRQGIGLTAAGLAVGIAGALLLTRSLSTLLFEVSALDVPTWSAVAVLLITAGLAACWIPARRAMRLDPARALRHD
jgi:putative ABC transport system permease protein